MTTHHTWHSPVLIVGGSLAGLMTGLALARRGIASTLLERSDPLPRTGAALGADERPVERVTGVRLTGRGGPSSGLPLSWTAVHDQLQAAVQADPAITLLHDTRVVRVGQSADQAWADTDDGRRFTGDVLIGADGHRSVVRPHVAPDHPDASFAGYVIWLGVADEQELEPHGSWPRNVAFLSHGHDYLLGYPLPGKHGSIEPGQRRLGWAWYDASRNNLLRDTGSVHGQVVQHSLSGSDVPASTLRELDEQADQQWPNPWRDAVQDGIARHKVTGTPIAEYVPEQLARDRIAIVGDAAHVPTPMTGEGFSASLRDAEALAAAMRHSGPTAAALQQYETDRLADARAMVVSGQQFSRSIAQP